MIKSASWKLACRIRVTRSAYLGEVIAKRMPEDQAGVRIVHFHGYFNRYVHIIRPDSVGPKTYEVTGALLELTRDTIVV